MKRTKIQRQFVNRLKKLKQEQGDDAASKALQEQITQNIYEKTEIEWCKKNLLVTYQFDPENEETIKKICINRNNIKDENQMNTIISEKLEEAGIVKIEQDALTGGGVGWVVVAFKAVAFAYTAYVCYRRPRNCSWKRSDRRLKRDITPLNRKTSRGAPLYSFYYKNSEHGKGLQIGVMAQDLLKMGMSDAVIMGEDGFYKVDYNRV